MNMTILFTVALEAIIVVALFIAALHYHKIIRPIVIAERFIQIYKLKKLTDLLKSKGESIHDLNEFYRNFQKKEETHKERIEEIEEEYKIKKPSEKKAK